MSSPVGKLFKWKIFGRLNNLKHVSELFQMENVWLAKYFLRKAAMTLNFHKMMDIDRSHTDIEKPGSQNLMRYHFQSLRHKRLMKKEPNQGSDVLGFTAMFCWALHNVLITTAIARLISFFSQICPTS